MDISTSLNAGLNTGLTQALSDGEHEYLYGAGRIAQLDMDTLDTEYFLGDALGSVRQLTDQTGAVAFAQTYDPYGVVTASTGSSASGYGFTGEYQQDGLVYLRARHYAPGMGRFLTRDTWSGDANRPLSFNRWNYTDGNPVNFTDPSGYKRFPMSCFDSNDPICADRALQLKQVGNNIKEEVRAGGLLPVEGFARYVDYALPLFDNNIRGMMWALTITIDGFDLNGKPLPLQIGNPNFTYWLGYDWLPYKQSREVPNWGGTQNWIDSKRGDWKEEYWDKTANQAFHFWFYVALTYDEDLSIARFANWYHDNPNDWEEINFLDDSPPPPSGATREDWNLSNVGMELGQILRADWNALLRIWQAECDSEWQDATGHVFTSPGAWIRTNLKAPPHGMR